MFINIARDILRSASKKWRLQTFGCYRIFPIFSALINFPRRVRVLGKSRKEILLLGDALKHCNELQDDEEWTEIKKRFKVEGIDYFSLNADDRVIHVWRWLVDAEINLKNSRHRCNKLRGQQNEDLEETENYVGKVRELSEKCTIDIANESTKMHQLEETISSILEKTDVQGSSIMEKITNLVADYLKFTKLRSNSHIQSDDLISELISISTEKEALRWQVVELNERMQFLLKSSRELEVDNEKLVFKLSEAFAELEEKEIRLGEITTMFCGEPANVFNSLNFKPNDSNMLALSRFDVDQSNATDKKNPSLEFRTESISPNTFNDSVHNRSTSKLSSLMTSCHEMARAEENNKLQFKCGSLKSKLAILGEKYNNLALKYIQLKAKKKIQIDELRGRTDASLCQIETLQVQLSVHRQRLRAEEIFRKQIESDLRKLQDEKRNVIVRLQNSEMEQKENNREIIILQKKIGMLDGANSELLTQLLELKYGRLPSTKLFDNEFQD